MSQFRKAIVQKVSEERKQPSKGQNMKVEFLKDTWIYKKGQVVSDLSKEQVQAVLFSGEAKLVERTAVFPQAVRKAITKG